MALYILGVGTGGINALNYIVDQKLNGIELIGVDTYAGALAACKAKGRIQLGSGLGTDGNPELGKKAAEAHSLPLIELFHKDDRVFILSSFGGGTGTGAAPLIARFASESRAQVTAVITQPFSFEGTQRSLTAQMGISQLKPYVYDLIMIANNELLPFAGNSNSPSLREAFSLADRMMAWQVLSRLL